MSRWLPLLLALLLSSAGVRAEYEDPLDELEFREPYMGVVPSWTQLEVYDPLEPLNRRLFKFNRLADEYLILPIIDGYAWLVPGPVRQGISNFYNNLFEVPALLNLGLQFEGQRALTTVGRLGVNTTLGLFGVFDIATPMGLHRQEADFGQTLAVWGVNQGPYLMLPLLGPSNLRDTAGMGVDILVHNEANFLGVAESSSRAVELTALGIVDTRYNVPFRYADVDSPFDYELVRLLWTQQRQLKVLLRNGELEDNTAAGEASRMVPLF